MSLCFDCIGCYTFCENCIHKEDCMDDNIEFAVSHDDKFLPMDGDYSPHCGFREIKREKKHER